MKTRMDRLVSRKNTRDGVFYPAVALVIIVLVQYICGTTHYFDRAGLAAITTISGFGIQFLIAILIFNMSKSHH